MSESVLITLPLPPKGLYPNDRLHWRPKAKITAAYRKAVGLIAVSTGGWDEPWEKATIRATFYCKTNKRRDDVNFLAALKAAYDGLVDSGLLEDDDSEHLTTLPCSFAIDKDNPRVELVVERVS